MFGNKAPFGGSSTFQSNTSTFGASKSLGSGFGTPFGSAAPNTSIFSTSTTPGTSIFGASTSNFGQPSTSSTGFGAFSSSSSTVPSLFSTNQTAGSNLFQSPSTSAFGAPKSSFGGFGGTSGTGMFNQNQQTTSLFNQGSTSSSTSLFGSSAGFNTGAFGGGATGPTGTTVKFNAVTGTDTMVKNGVTTNINIRHQCVTIMKEYENKSFEELRIEDYQANRKGPQQGGMGTFGTAQPSLFGSSTTPAVSTGLFQNQNKSIFGTSATPGASTSTVFGQPMQQQQQNTGFLFGGPKPAPFGTAVTTASTFNFGGTTGSSLFGSTATNQNKSLFGTTTSTPGTGLFGASNTLTQTSTGFGTPGFGSAGFGVQNQSGTGLFANKSAFGATTTSAAPSFSFGNQTNTNVSTPFATKPTTAFGTGTGFGSSTSAFGGGFGTTNSLFNQNKPAPAFGNTGSTGFASSLGSLGTGGSSLFAGAVNKPGLGLGTSFSTPLGTVQRNEDVTELLKLLLHEISQVRQENAELKNELQKIGKLVTDNLRVNFIEIENMETSSASIEPKLETVKEENGQSLVDQQQAIDKLAKKFDTLSAAARNRRIVVQSQTWDSRQNNLGQTFLIENNFGLINQYLFWLIRKMRQGLINQLVNEENEQLEMIKINDCWYYWNSETKRLEKKEKKALDMLSVSEQLNYWKEELEKLVQLESAYFLASCSRDGEEIMRELNVDKAEGKEAKIKELDD